MEIKPFNEEYANNTFWGIPTDEVDVDSLMAELEAWARLWAWNIPNKYQPYEFMNIVTCQDKPGRSASEQPGGSTRSWISRISSVAGVLMALIKSRCILL